MNELSILEIISNTLSKSDYLGDDCAYLEDLDIFVTHDTLVQDVHFSMYTISPYLLGRKSIAVNLSDLAAALCVPKYVTVSLSMPSNTNQTFIEDFYRGINDICNEYDVKVVGGDLTASDKISVSVCAIGKKNSEFLTSRKYAKKGYYVVVTGFHGSSSAGFHALSEFLYADEKLINAHLNPAPALTESGLLSSLLTSNIAVMDTSDGLIDALYKIATASKHSIEIDVNKVLAQDELLEFCNNNSLDYKKFVLWGGEDYQLVACVPEDMFKSLDDSLFVCIGRVMNKDTHPCVFIKDNFNTEKVTKEILISNSYKHFIN
ncbi:thiamine-phosphate kinase [bacterium]|nr:thiamine-phosphate kinase [bacterium]